jgi:hypothetical protein
MVLYTHPGRSVLLIMALFGDVECSTKTFPVEISIRMPVPEADLLLLHGRKMRQGIGRAAEVDVAKVSLAKTRALSVKESSANAEVLRSPSLQAELACAVCRRALCHRLHRLTHCVLRTSSRRASRWKQVTGKRPPR